MKSINNLLNEGTIISVKDYIIKTQIDKDCEFLIEEPIDEGIIRDGVKKVWKWIKNKITGNKKRKSSYYDYDYDSNDFTNMSSNSMIPTSDKNLFIKQFSSINIGELIYQNNNLKQFKDLLSKYNNDDYKIKFVLLLNKQKEPCAIIAYTTDFKDIKGINEYTSKISDPDKAVFLIAFYYDNDITIKKSVWKSFFVSLCGFARKEIIFTSKAQFDIDRTGKIFGNCKFDAKTLDSGEHFYINSLSKINEIDSDDK